MKGVCEALLRSAGSKSGSNVTCNYEMDMRDFFHADGKHLKLSLKRSPRDRRGWCNLNLFQHFCRDPREECVIIVSKER